MNTISNPSGSTLSACNSEACVRNRKSESERILFSPKWSREQGKKAADKQLDGFPVASQLVKQGAAAYTKRR